MNTDVLFALKEHTRAQMRRDGVIGGSRIKKDVVPRDMESVYFEQHPDIGVLTHEQEANNAGFHDHLHFEMCYVVSGECHQDLDNGEYIVLHRGNVIILNPKARHSCTIADASDNVIVIAIRPAFFNAAFFSFFDAGNSLSDFFLGYLMSESSPKYMIFMNDYNEDTDRMMEMLIRAWLRNDPFVTTELKSCLVLLFSQLLLYSPKEKGRPQDAKFASIISYLTNHLQTVTLASAAEHFHFHPNYLSAYVKKHSGRTFSSILTELRVMQAKYYLSGTDLPISQIVTLVGYQDQPSFNATFKKNTGYTPSRFRELQTQN